MKTEEWGEIAARFHLVPDGEGGWVMDFPVGTRRENFNKICERLITGEIAAAGLRALVGELADANKGLRRRIHMIERHNQHFERCESAWCNPDKTNNPALIGYTLPGAKEARKP